MLAISNLLFRDGDRRFRNRAETAQKQRLDDAIRHRGDAYFFDVDVGDSKNRLSPICHHDKALIINNLDVNGDR